MKYPQLVSTRAVNAISDWLVSRLEQLGVDAPQIYTRLLLSLLQSSVQVNDPIEFSNLEKFFTNCKGNTKRYLPCDTDTLKKLNAIQCLREIVSSEHEIATIEVLVNELFEKLKDIEKQSSNIENEDKLVVATLSVVNKIQPSQYNHQQTTEDTINNADLNKRGEYKDQKVDTAAAIDIAIDIETDPKKRYFNAFPALSKEMEDSFRIWRRNAKSMTWPVDRNNISISSSSSSSTLSASFGSRGFVKKLDINVDDSLKLKATSEKNCKENVEFKNLNCRSDFVASTSAIGAKRKSKRRRNQALCKGKTIQNIRKNSSGGAVGGTTGDIGGKYFRNTSPTYWDTDFEGCWEMGRDLIKEFKAKQNMNRNRSTSESDAYTIKSRTLVDDRLTTFNEPKMIFEENKCNDIADKISNNSSPLMPVVDISFCCDDDADDTLASISELTTDNSFGTIAAEPRRLYQRDIIHEPRVLVQKNDTLNEDETDFEQLKAKFNSKVEALWNDAEPEAAINENTTNVFSLEPLQMQTPYLPTIAPFTENLKNFWTNYYSANLDLSKIPQQLQQSNSTINTSLSGKEESSTSLSCNGSTSGLNFDHANTSDYYSMPANLDNFDKSVGSVRRDFTRKINENRSTPVNVFLQNSIWSEASNSGAGDTDESFYFKVWNSNKNWSQGDGFYDNKILAPGSTKVIENAFQFPYYNNPISKWSEGINAGPNQQQPIGTSNTKSIINNNFLQNINNNNDCTDSVSAATVLVNSGPSSYPQPSSQYNWQTRESDFNPWCPISPMTEACDAMNKRSIDNEKNTSEITSSGVLNVDENNPIEVKPLPNHSISSSAFVDYALVKALGKSTKQESNNIYPPQVVRPKERYSEDENLLTSERTHFRPVKTFEDGHVFDISGDLDVVDYERSPSGYFYLHKVKYLEYNRKDHLMVEDDTSNSTSSTAPLYATSNCEAAKAFADNFNKIANKHDFVLKFRLRSTDMACQTEECESNPLPICYPNSNDVQALEQHPLYMIFSSANSGIRLQTTDMACYDAVEALNKAVFAAAKASALLPSERHWLPSITSGYCRESSAWNMVQNTTQIDEECSDEVDFCAEAAGINEDNSNSSSTLNKQWSMYEIGKKCSSKGHNVAAITNNNPGDLENDATHTLWGMCAACNNEYKSVPANSLLRDELNVEGDKIMKDLQFMQNLYICKQRAENAAINNSNCDASADVVGDDSTNNSFSNKTQVNLIEVKNSPQNVEIVDSNLDEGCTVAASGVQQSQNREVIQKFSQFIVDLLNPEFRTNLKDDEKLVLREQKQFSGSLWYGGNNSRNIWQQSDRCDSGNTLMPLELFRQLNDPSINVIKSDKEQLKPVWEHENLAELWRQQTPTQQLDQVATITNYTSESCNDNANNFIIEIETEMNCDDVQLNSVQNEENTVTSFTASNISDSLVEMKSEKNDEIKQKRVEQFLNSNIIGSPANKLKYTTRKRRHSASQNLFHHPPTAISSNNNNANICDLNSFNIKETSQLYVNNVFQCDNEDNDIDMQKIINTAMCDALTKSSNMDALEAGATVLGENYATRICSSDGLNQPKQTIITCKYWTTIEPIGDNLDPFDGNTFPASILNHVTMVTRPLTR